MSKRKCIFCGAPQLSKEHFWPKWLAPYIPKPPINAHISEIHSAEGKAKPIIERRSERPGGVETKKIRVVCSGCNNGWMSNVESSAKQVINALMGSLEEQLSADETYALARWIALKTIVGEYASENTALTPDIDRKQLKAGIIPGYFRIFVAYHTDTTYAAFYRHSTTMSTTLAGPRPALESDINRNIQATSYYFGSLFAFVTTARIDGFDHSILDPGSGMTQLWPEMHSPCNLSVSNALSKEQVGQIAKRLEWLIEHPHVIYGGPFRRY